MLFEALAGYPPFAGATVDETWQNLKRWQRVLRKPQYDDPNYFLSKRTWDLITRLVAAKEHRFKNINEIHKHEYFAEVDFATLREQKAPFVPELDSETDAGYFDDFSNEADMAKYKEVHDKQKALEEMADRDEKMSKALFVGFTFRYVVVRVRRRAADADTVLDTASLLLMLTANLAAPERQLPLMGALALFSRPVRPTGIGDEIMIGESGLRVV
jgi:hypothetical protein